MNDNLVDLMHILPKVKVFSLPIDYSNSDRYTVIELSNVYAKNMVEEHENFKKFLKRFPSKFEYAIIAFKRVLHLTFVSFSTKYLIYLLSIKKTFHDYKQLHENDTLIELYNEALLKFKSTIEGSSACFQLFRKGFNPHKFNQSSTLSSDESNFILKSIINSHNSKNICSLFQCAFLLSEIMLGFSLLISEVFQVMDKFLHKIYQKSMIQLIDIKELQMKPAKHFKSSLTNELILIMDEFNFLHSIPTKNNPSLYYKLMMEMSFITYIEELNSNEIFESFIKLFGDDYHFEIADIIHNHDRIMSIFSHKQTQDLLAPNMVISLKSVELSQQLYAEFFFGELNIITHAIPLIAAFSVKCQIILFIDSITGNAAEESKKKELSQKLYFDDKLMALKNVKHTFKDYVAFKRVGKTMKLVSLSTNPLNETLVKFADLRRTSIKRLPLKFDFDKLYFELERIERNGRFYHSI
ncbi:hypothetical protein SNEBB_003257 [Seison nebaliae]|nr:hypothetical protein SNEBB_003257 [Seison nebaliae]